MKTSSPGQHITDHLFGWWYMIATPSDRSGDASLYERTSLRKCKFVSIILLIEIVYHVVYLCIETIPVARDPAAIPPISITIGCFVIGVILNRLGRQIVASIIAFVAIELSMCLYFVTQSFVAGGFSPKDFAVLSILVSPDIIAVSLFSVWVALSLCTFNCVFVIVVLAFFPKTDAMLQQLATIGPIDYYQAVSVQAVVILVSLFWVTNTVGEMARADQAEEVNKLMQTLAAQQAVALQEKQQLEESIQQIVAVHTQVANGNLSARVPLDQKNVLWSIAGSLNNLLARLQRWHQEAQQLQSVERSIQHTIHDIQRAKTQGTPLTYRRTGTILDPLIAAFLGGTDPHPLFHQQRDPMKPMPDQLFRSQREGITPIPDQPFRLRRNDVSLESDQQR
jgi:hypothetical protein